MKTGNIWICILLHAIYNFGGSVIEDCGKGIIWDSVTVTVTAVIAVAATVYMVVMFFKIKRDEINRMYN